MTGTPLSDLIDTYIDTDSDDDFRELLREFRLSDVGVIVVDRPERLARTPELRYIAFADPEAVARPRFTTIVTGDEVLRLAAAIPDGDGVDLFSATSVISIVLDRATVKRLLDW